MTTVNDPLCVFCVNVSNRALLSHSDRFTDHDAIGTPNTGGWPSWVSNDTIVLGNGSATQWYYRLGMPEAAEWFADVRSLRPETPDAARRRSRPHRRPARGRARQQPGDDPAPQDERPAAGEAARRRPAVRLLTRPDGKFADPTWSSDGRLLAWQEDDGVWPGRSRRPASCAGCPARALRIPGASEPDLSPARDQPRPAPAVRQPRQPDCLRRRSRRRATRAHGRTRVRHRGRSPRARELRDRRHARASTSEDPRAAAQAASHGRVRGPGCRHAHRPAHRRTALARRAIVLASGRRAYAAAGKAKFTIKLTRQGPEAPSEGPPPDGQRSRLSFKPTGAKAIST